MSTFKAGDVISMQCEVIEAHGDDLIVKPVHGDEPFKSAFSAYHFDLVKAAPQVEAEPEPEVVHEAEPVPVPVPAHVES